MYLEFFKVVVLLLGGCLSITLIFLSFKLLRVSDTEWKDPKINIVPVVNGKNNTWSMVANRRLPEKFNTRQ